MNGRKGHFVIVMAFLCLTSEHDEKDFSVVETPTVLQSDLALSAPDRCLGPLREQRVDFST